MRGLSFIHDTELTPEDIHSLSPKIANWGKLNSVFKDSKLSEVVINKLILIEVNHKKRLYILNKLIQRRTSDRRKAELDEIKGLIRGKR